MATVLMINGKPETVFSERDFQELIDQCMGFDAMRYFRELVDELENLREKEGK